MVFFLCKQKTAYEMRISDWSSDVCSSDLLQALEDGLQDYSPNVKAAAGAIVTIDRNGEAVIHRGLMREAEAKALRTLERLRQGFGSEGEDGNDDTGEESDDAPKTAAMSEDRKSVVKGKSVYVRVDLVVSRIMYKTQTRRIIYTDN